MSTVRPNELFLAAYIAPHCCTFRHFSNNFKRKEPIIKSLQLYGFIGILLLTAPRPDAAFGLTEVAWWHAMGAENGERVEKLAADFNASQQKFKVLPTYKGNYTDTMTSAVAAFRARKQPHIVQVFEVGTATMMAAKGAVYPVEEMMTDAGVTFVASIYLPAVISYYQTSAGDLLSMPFNSSTPILWYNKAALAQAGIKTPPATWDEMFKAAELLVNSGMKCGFSFGWQSWVMIENFSAWHNQPIGTQENGFAGFNAQLSFNTEATKKRIQSIADSQAKAHFVYGGREDDSLPLFTNGQCGMWISSSANVAALKNQAKFEFGQAMLPLDTSIAKTPQNSIIGGATLWVLRGHSKASYRGVAAFLTYLSSAKVQAWWHQETGYVPITLAATELSREQGFYESNPGNDVAIKQLTLNTPTANSRGLRFGNFVQIRTIINEELEAVWSGQKTASQGLDDAVMRGNKLLRRFERAN
ncbi:MAG: sn-glycerol-3-phosphate ABC transporter substrate-binding protein UgpB [Pseudomonadota bacterium]